eukprot:scaffold7471_cov51-Attheya_sp.AAC.1
MWPKRAHILAPLTGLQGKKDVQWTEIYTAAFNAMKALMAKPDKCEWAIQETDWLGYWLTPTGLKPWHICAHVLAPLTALQGKKDIKWKEIHTEAFNTMKALMAKDCLLSYPDPNQPYDIETNASDYQMGAIIKQNGRPVAYFSRKLRDSQLNYTTIEKETLSIVECLQEFHSMLYGAHNVVADAFFRVPHSLEEESSESKTGIANVFAIELDDVERASGVSLGLPNYSALSTK